MGAQKLIQHDLFGAAPVILEPKNRKTAEEAAERFRELSRPDMVKVTPATPNAPPAYVPRPGRSVPNLMLGKWASDGAGKYHLVPVAGRWVRLTSELCSELGFRNTSSERKYTTLRRLAEAGYVELVKISPCCILIDLDSWWRHVADCMENPDMWEEGSDERNNYLKANGLGGWKQKVRPAKKKHTRLGKVKSGK